MTLILTVPFKTGLILACDRQNTSRNPQRNHEIVGNKQIPKKFHIDNFHQSFVIAEWNLPEYNWNLIRQIENDETINATNVVEKIYELTRRYMNELKTGSLSYAQGTPTFNMIIITNNLEMYRIFDDSPPQKEETNIINTYPLRAKDIQNIKINIKYFLENDAIYMACSIIQLTSSFVSGVGSPKINGVDIIKISEKTICHSKDNLYFGDYNLFKCFKKIYKKTR